MQYHRHSSKLVLGLLLVVGCPGSDAGKETATDSEDTETTADTATSVDTDTFNSESDTFDIDATDTGTDEIAVPEDPGELGPCTFTQFKGSAKGTDGSHKIPVTVYLPDQCPAPFPVIVFSHGFQLAVGLYKSTAEHFASWGYIVALGEHREAMLPPTTDAMIVQDITDVAKWVLAESTAKLEGKVDATKTAFVGHSKGGKESLLALTQHKDLAQTAIAFDPADMIPGTINAKTFKDLTAPVLVLGETWSKTHAIAGQACAPKGKNFEAYWEFLPPDLLSEQIKFKNAFHMSWLDNVNCGLTCSLCPDNPSADHAEVRRLSLRYAISWLEVHLRGNTEFETFLTGADMKADVASDAVSYLLK